MVIHPSSAAEQTISPERGIKSIRKARNAAEEWLRQHATESEQRCGRAIPVVLPIRIACSRIPIPNQGRAKAQPGASIMKSADENAKSADKSEFTHGARQ